MYTTDGNSEIGLFDSLKPIDIVIGADRAEAKLNNLMASAVFDGTNYISPTDADIAEAGPEWKKGPSNVEYRQYWDNKFEEITKPLPIMAAVDNFPFSIIFDEVELPTAPIPKMEVEDITHLPKRRNPTTYDWWWM